ncbi:SIAE acetylesterase, partial [Polypterus senegalus]
MFLISHDGLRTRRPPTMACFDLRLSCPTPSTLRLTASLQTSLLGRTILCLQLPRSRGLSLRICLLCGTASVDLCRHHIQEGTQEQQSDKQKQKFGFASYYGDHMVLQREPARAVIWGYGSNEANVTLTLLGHVINVSQIAQVVDVIQYIRHNVPPDIKSEPDMAVQYVTKRMKKVINSSEELSQAEKFHDVRVFSAALEQSEAELYDLPRVLLPWSVPSAEVLGAGNFTYFSAVCWLFGRYLYAKLKYPIGLVESCWGGTIIEVWSSPRALKKCIPARSLSRLPKVEAAPLQPSVLWNAMIHPLLNMTIKGVIWYQAMINYQWGQDTGKAHKYTETVKPTSTASQGLCLPQQISTSERLSKSEDYPILRWHQTADMGFVPNARMKNTFMAVSLDLVDDTSPWGRYKQDVAFRLTLGARAVVYGEKVSFQGPFPSKINYTEKVVNVTFSQEILYKGFSDNLFQFCCTDKETDCSSKNAAWETAQVVDHSSNSVHLLAPCSNDIGLRYAWFNWPCSFKQCSIYSADDILPAPPFIFNPVRKYQKW